MVDIIITRLLQANTITPDQLAALLSIWGHHQPMTAALSIWGRRQRLTAALSIWGRRQHLSAARSIWGRRLRMIFNAGNEMARFCGPFGFQ